MSRKSTSENIEMHKKRMQSIRDKMNRENLKKVIKDHAKQHWSLKLCMAIFVVGLLSFPLLKMVLISASLLAGAFVGGLISYWFNSNKNTDHIVHDYISNMQQLLVLESKRKRNIIQDQLNDFGSKKGSDQVMKFYKAFDDLKGSLSKQFSQTEITYKRYAEAANEVLLSGIDNLEDVIIALKSIKDIDKNYLKERIKKLENSIDEYELKEKKILEKRLNMYEQEVDRINNMILENEKAVDQMNITTSALNNSKKKGEEKDVDEINAAIKDLRLMTNKLTDNV